MAYDRPNRTGSLFNPPQSPVYAMLVSRSASYLASTLQPQRRNDALAEVVSDAVTHCGEAAVASFLVAVLSWLRERDYQAAAEVVVFYIKSGTAPEVQEASPIKRR